MGKLNSLNQPFDSNFKHIQTQRLTRIIVSSYEDSFDKRMNKQKKENPENIILTSNNPMIDMHTKKKLIDILCQDLNEK